MGEFLAHSGPTAAEEVLAFHPHWDVYGLVALIALGYFWGVPRLAATVAPQGEPAVSGRQQIVFSLGLVLWVAVSTWPLHDIGEKSLFMFHMIEHMTLAWVVPPLLLLGSPWWFTRWLVQPILPVLQRLTRPLLALVLFNLALAAIHAPGVVELMVTNDAFHFAAHFTLMATAFLLWWPIIGPIPETTKLAPLGSIGYLFANSLVPTIPASFLTFATGVVYPVYSGFPRLWNIDVITDQTVAGLIMKIGGGLLLWSVITVVFFRWWAEEQRYSPSRPRREPIKVG
jgi:putative membrane protein